MPLDLQTIPSQERGRGFLSGHRGSKGYDKNFDNYGAGFLSHRRPPYERQDDQRV